jgi:hypothetical protein
VGTSFSSHPTPTNRIRTEYQCGMSTGNAVQVSQGSFTSTSHLATHIITAALNDGPISPSRLHLSLIDLLLDVPSSYGIGISIHSFLPLDYKFPQHTVSQSLSASVFGSRPSNCVFLPAPECHMPTPKVARGRCWKPQESLPSFSPQSIAKYGNQRCDDGAPLPQVGHGDAVLEVHNDEDGDTVPPALVGLAGLGDSARTCKFCVFEEANEDSVCASSSMSQFGLTGGIGVVGRCPTATLVLVLQLLLCLRIVGLPPGPDWTVPLVPAVLV